MLFLEVSAWLIEAGGASKQAATAALSPERSIMLPVCTGLGADLEETSAVGFYYFR